MQAVEIEVAVRRQLARVLESPGFSRNERLSRFLRFVVERHLESGGGLKESVIGVEVFGRPPDYNPKQDAIVRNEAGRLRARLGEYYAGQGKDDAWIIELPKGGYVPLIRHAAMAPDLVAASRLRFRASIVLAIFITVSASLALLWTLAFKSRDSKPGLRRYANSAAYDLYSSARAAYHAGNELPDANVDLYQQAIAKDPAFAPAYAGLAAAYAFISNSPTGDQKDSLVKMWAAAQRAVQLDPLLPEAHDAMGVVYARLGQWDQSRQSFTRAIELDPNVPAARLDSVMNLFLPAGWISNALQQVRLAEKSDPRSPNVQDVYTYVLISVGQFDQAEEHCRKSVDPVECLGRIRIGQGRIDEAIQVLAAAPNARYLGYAYGRAGRREQAEKLAAISPGKLQQVLIYAGLGDKDRTFQALDRMTELGPVRVGRTLTFPELAFLRGDPRLKTLRRKAGLPE